MISKERAEWIQKFRGQRRRPRKHGKRMPVQVQRPQAAWASDMMPRQEQMKPMPIVERPEAELLVKRLPFTNRPEATLSVKRLPFTNRPEATLSMKRLAPFLQSPATEMTQSGLPETVKGIPTWALYVGGAVALYFGSILLSQKKVK